MCRRLIRNITSTNKSWSFLYLGSMDLAHQSIKSDIEKPTLRMARVVRKGLLRDIDQDKDDTAYWRTKSVKERAAAVTFLISQSLKPGERMDKSFVRKKKLHDA